MTTQVPPDREQRDRILNELDTCMLVEAAAGTGKTASMVGRMVELLRKGSCSDIRTMAAVTFTRKAAAELRARFQVALEAAVRQAAADERERLENALVNIEQCFVGTIHSFCGRLLRERPVEAGVDLAFEEIDEETDALLRDESWREYCARLVTDDSEGLLAELSRMGIPLTDLEPAFATFALYPDVDRWPVPAEDRELEGLEQAVSALEQYVSRMRKAAADLPTDCGNDTLIPAFLSIPRVVSHYSDMSDPRQLMEVLEARFDRGVKVVQKVWARAGYGGEEAKAEAARWDEFRREVAAPLLRAWRESRYEPVMRVMLQARELYDSRRAERGQLNFQDLLMKAARLLRGNAHIRRYFTERFTHLLVDEFQDTDPVQAEVMLLLTSSDPEETEWRRCRPRPGSLFVVGDPKQSIYRFRRADIVTYNDVKQIILSADGGAPGTLVTLSANFRTIVPLVEWVNRVFEPPEVPDSAGPGIMTRFPAEASEQSPAYVALEAGRAHDSPGELNGVYTLYVDEAAGNRDQAVEYEADFIARFIRGAVDDGVTVSRTSGQLEAGQTPPANPSDFMIVTRNRTDLSVYAAKLQQYGVPHQVTGGTTLNEVAELRLLRDCLDAVARPDDPVALVAALRGEAFGISDAALYRFKKEGGKFNFNNPVPGTLVPDDREAFSDAFERLQRYHLWLSKLPAVSAIENIIADLGLMVLASARPGGDVQAGSIGKALELIRSVQRDNWSTVQLAAYLGRVVGIHQKYDGISASSVETPSVRLMNLHKVKGLEAPVVFLANAYGESPHEVGIHIDRSGEEVLGYMAVRGPRRGWAPGPLLAHPEHWDELAEREGAFGAAEGLRLRYVAATRAGAVMIVTQRPKPGMNRFNAWRHFLPELPADSVLDDPGARGAPERPRAAISPDEASDAVGAIASRLERAQTPTYRVGAAKDIALSSRGGAPRIEESAAAFDEAPVPSGEHGVEWGQAVHQLLELAMREPGADLASRAVMILEENGIDIEHAGSAVDTATSVTVSDIWGRAVASGRPFSEVPFELMLDDTEPPTIVRGAIDLVFPEEEGWVLVDYKTDRITSEADVETLLSKYAPQLALYKYAWECCTGETVRETGLYFTGIAEYRPL